MTGEPIEVGGVWWRQRPAPFVDLMPIYEHGSKRQVRRIATASDLANRALREAGHDHVPARHLGLFVRGIGYVAREHGLPVGRIVTPIRKQG